MNALAPHHSSPARSSVPSLKTTVARIQDVLNREHIGASDMSRSGSLELGIGSGPIEDPRHLPSAWPLKLERLEGEITARRLVQARPGVSRFRYFLDGSQRTLPVWRIGLVPIVISLSAAGILERDELGQPWIRGETFGLEQSWIFPLETGRADLDRLAQVLVSRGELHDPLYDKNNQRFEHYDELAGHYGKLIYNTQILAGRLRADQEQGILTRWSRDVSPVDPDAWIVVDGRLHENTPNAIGLVKNLQTQHLIGEEAEALFNLPQGHRTTAFRYVSNSATEPTSPSMTEGRTMWYMRLWDATGLDARHALIRVEAAHDVCTTVQIDEISGWLLAERIPRAKSDPRWPTLLYPIHYLELILKRRLASVTAGWPS
jgi:hypothetical protein